MSRSTRVSINSVASRRDVVRVAGMLAAGVASGCLPDRIPVGTHAYKTVGGLAIRADVYRRVGDEVLPAAVWIHGGALIMGSRQSVPRKLKELLIRAGFVVASIDYRLAPNTKLPSILEDVEDALAWIRSQGPELFRADPECIVVLGASAGGYLTLATGHRVEPRPAALVSFWGYADLIGPWYSTPSPHARHHRTAMSREEALSQVSGPPISNSGDRKGDGGAFYQHCRQHGIWPREISGWDPRETPEKFEPYMPLNNVTSDYPPTLLVHGEDDTDVPYEQSVQMAERLREHGVPHELLSFDGAEHGLAGAGSGALLEAYTEAVRFAGAAVGN